MRLYCPICVTEQELRDDGGCSFCTKCGARIRAAADGVPYAILDDDKRESCIVECEERVIELKCPRCGEMLALKEEPLPGQNVRCPHCVEKFSFDASIRRWSRTEDICLCAKCHTSVERDSVFCPTCGGRLKKECVSPEPQATLSTNDRQEQFFDRIERMERARYEHELGKSDKSRLGFILFGLLLGVLGMHNFYIGRTGRGAFQLIFSFVAVLLAFVGIGLLMIVGEFIWILVEVCSVTEDAQGKTLS